MKPQETVVLAEYDEISGLPLRLRTVTCAPGTKFIIERLHLSADHVHTKEWICKDGERDITGRVRVFREMKDLPVTIRLLDPPLHEFLPHTKEEIEHLAKQIDISPDRLKIKIESLKEFNPMLGHRGCRLGITYPEIYEMQVRAIIEAACELAKEDGFKIIPEIMIPLVADVKELSLLRESSEKICAQVMKEKGVEK